MPKLYRKFGGKKYKLSGVIGSKRDAEFDAGEWRSRGGLARIVPIKKGKKGYALYLD